MFIPTNVSLISSCLKQVGKHAGRVVVGCVVGVALNVVSDALASGKKPTTDVTPSGEPKEGEL